MTENVLTLDESRRLIDLEKTIKRGSAAFVEVGVALCEIRDSRLYKSDFKTFEDYCLKKWKFERRQAYRLIEAAGVVKSLPEKCVQLDTITTESQARELAKVEPAARVEVLRVAAKSGKVTAKSIRQAAGHDDDGDDVKKPDMRGGGWFHNLSPERRYKVASYILIFGDQIKLPGGLDAVSFEKFKERVDRFLNAVKEANPGK